MRPKPTDEVSFLVARLHAEWPALDSQRLVQYLRDIVEWNERIGLVSRKTTISSLERLVRQSVQLYSFVRQADLRRPGSDRLEVVDIGTGAGFPGLVWKLLAPELAVTLVDRKRKKITFLQRTCVVLKLSDVEVVEGDAVELSSYERFRSRFDLGVSLAVGAPAEVAGLVEPFLRDGGFYCAVRPHEESVQVTDVGKMLSLSASKETEHGRFILFQKSVS